MNNLKKYILGQGVSQLGTTIYNNMLPIMYAIYFTSPNAAILISGGYSIGGILGSIIISKVGVFLRKKNWALYLDLLQGCIVSILTLFVIANIKSNILFAIMSFIFGICTSIFQTVSTEFTYTLGNKEEISKIALLRAAISNGGLAVGSAIVSIFIAKSNFRLAVGLNAVSFFVGALTLIFTDRKYCWFNIKSSIKLENTTRKINKKKEKGNVHISNKLKLMLVFSMLSYIFILPSTYLLTKVSVENSIKWKMSIIISVFGISSAILGFIIYLYKKIKLVSEYWFYSTLILFGICILCINISTNKFIIIFLGVMWALIEYINGVNLEIVIMSNTNDKTRGKTLANFFLCRKLANPIGFFITGILLKYFSSNISLNISMLLVIIIGLIGIISNNIWNFKSVKNYNLGK